MKKVWSRIMNHISIFIQSFLISDIKYGNKIRLDGKILREYASTGYTIDCGR